MSRDPGDTIPPHVWEEVMELSFSCVNAVLAECDCRRELMAKLEVIDEIYGKTARVLATRADFTDDTLTERIALLKEALALGEGGEDRLMTLDSLANVFIELIHLKRAHPHPEESLRRLLPEFAKLLRAHPDEVWSSTLDEARDLLRPGAPSPESSR